MLQARRCDDSAVRLTNLAETINGYAEDRQAPEEGVDHAASVGKTEAQRQLDRSSVLCFQPARIPSTSQPPRH
jgi:hypothetical protein